jgi:hypothetical protein
MTGIVDDTMSEAGKSIKELNNDFDQTSVIIETAEPDKAKDTNNL